MKKIYTLPELENMLTCRGEEENRLYSESKRIKNETIGNNVYLRGLIEISNICTKDCFYCGIKNLLVRKCISGCFRVGFPDAAIKTIFGTDIGDFN